MLESSSPLVLFDLPIHCTIFYILYAFIYEQVLHPGAAAKIVQCQASILQRRWTHIEPVRSADCAG